jgi:hypothetical protein
VYEFNFRRECFTHRPASARLGADQKGGFLKGLKYRFLWPVFFLVFWTGRVAAEFYITFPSDVDWVTRSSEHFDLLYPRGEENLAQRSLLAAERAFRLLDPIFPNGPSRTWMVLATFSDSTNGYAVPFPWPHMVIFAAPPAAADQLASFDRWLDSVILHEYVHIRHITPASGLWLPLRTIFGSWVVPNGLLPTHFHEGTAVLLETEFLKGGRGTAPYFSMIRRMAVDANVWGADNFFPLDRLDGASTIWPGGTAAYFFGYTLEKELWSRKGAKGINDLTTAYSRNWPFLVDLPLKEVFQTTYDKLWENIFEKTTAESRREINVIKNRGLSPLKYLTESLFNKSSVAISPDGTQVVYRKYLPADGSSLEWVNLTDGKVMDSVEISGGGGGEGTCWLRENSHDFLVYSEVIPKRMYSLNGVTIYGMDDKSKRGVQLTNGNRLDHVQQLSCSAETKTLLVYRETAGHGKIEEYRIDFSTANRDGKVTELVREWAIPEGSWVTSLLASKNNTAPHWFSLHTSGGTTLYRWDGEAIPAAITKLDTHIFSLRRNALSSEIFAIASFDGRNEIWSFDTNKKMRTKRVALLGGANSFDLAAPSEFIVSSYRHGGYDLAKAEPVVETSRAWTDGDSTTLTRGPLDLGEEKIPDMSAPQEYSAWSTLFPRAWVPSLLFVPNGTQFGAWIPGFDISQRHSYNIYGGYDTRGAPFLDAEYAYRFSGPLALGVSAFYLPSYIYTFNDFFTQWGGDVTLVATLPWGLPTVTFGPIFRRTEQSTLGQADQSVGVRVVLEEKLGFKRRPQSISPVRGTKLRLGYEQYLTAFGGAENYFRTYFGVDQYLEAPWAKEHVIFASLKLGYTEGSWFYNSYFDSGGELLFQQYRANNLNRGFDPQLFVGRRMANLNLEYRFPIARVEHGIDLWPLHLNNIHGAIVWDTTTFDYGQGSPRDGGVIELPEGALFNQFFTSVGAELKTEWKFFYYVPTEIRFGLYHGFGPNGENIYFTCGVDAAL